MADETKDLQQMLEELYLSYVQQAKAIHEKDPDNWGTDEAWDAGLACGGMNAIGAVYLSLFGGRKMFALWQAGIEANTEEENA